jgi:hypothetical protein
MDNDGRYTMRNVFVNVKEVEITVKLPRGYDLIPMYNLDQSLCFTSVHSELERHFLGSRRESFTKIICRFTIKPIKL